MTTDEQRSPEPCFLDHNNNRQIGYRGNVVYAHTVDKEWDVNSYLVCFIFCLCFMRLDAFVFFFVSIFDFFIFILFFYFF